MDTLIFGDYTVQDLLLVIGIGIVILVILRVFKKIFSSQKTNPHMQFAACKSCGWQGQVSRHAGRCPACNQALGDRMLGAA